MKNRNQKVIIFDLDDTLFDSTNQPKDTGGEWPIQVFDGFHTILALEDCRHILVTRGTDSLQNRKIDILGIRNYFSDIYIVDSDNQKHETFMEIQGVFPDSEIVVIGNRIDCEIRYGNLLGLKTILVKHGKYEVLVPKDDYELPTNEITISEIGSLRDLI